VRVLTAAASIATCVVSGWMCLMYFVLRHPGYVWRAAIAAIICAGAAALITGQPPAALRMPLAAWGAALAAFGIWALAAPGDDGWVLVAALIFVVEGSLTIVASIRPPQSA
jgi:hypothetical protein